MMRRMSYKTKSSTPPWCIILRNLKCLSYFSVILSVANIKTKKFKKVRTVRHSVLLSMTFSTPREAYPVSWDPYSKWSLRQQFRRNRKDTEMDLYQIFLVPLNLRGTGQRHPVTFLINKEDIWHVGMLPRLVLYNTPLHNRMT